MHDPTPPGDDRELERRLGRLTPGGVNEARERARLAARVHCAAPASARDASRPAVASSSGRRGRGARRIVRLLPATLSGSALLTILLLATLTTPGQAVAEWVGERFGIGQPGGPPTMTELRELTDGSSDTGAAIVIASGRDPNGNSFEILTWTENATGHRCFGLDIPGLSALTNICIDRDLPTNAGLQIMSLNGNESGYFLIGRITPDVASVRALFRGNPIEVQRLKVSQSLLTRVGIDRSFHFIVSSIRTSRGGPIEITARAANGQILAVNSIAVPSIGLEHSRPLRRKDS